MARQALTAAGSGTAGAGAAGAGAQQSSLASVPALRKRLVQASAPRAQRYPEWLDGRWRLSLRFVRAVFPFAEVNPAFQKRLLQTASVPGFRKLSIAATPDVGAEEQIRGMRFSSGRADAAWNITQAIETGMGESVSVRSVEERGDNRMTVALRGVPGAERIELFTNARASATRFADGDNDGDGNGGGDGAGDSRRMEIFEASESIRQVTLGYSSQYGMAREDIGDYSHVWAFTRYPWVAAGDSASDGNTEEDMKVRVHLTTAAYLQPNEALSLTSPGGSAPDASQLLDFSTRPVVVYKHSGSMTRYASDS